MSAWKEYQTITCMRQLCCEKKLKKLTRDLGVVPQVLGVVPSWNDNQSTLSEVNEGMIV